MTFENTGENQAKKQEKRSKKTYTFKAALNDNKSFFYSFVFFSPVKPKHYILCFRGTEIGLQTTLRGLGM